MSLKDQKLNSLTKAPVLLPKMTKERRVVTILTRIIDAHKSCFLVIKSPWLCCQHKHILCSVSCQLLTCLLRYSQNKLCNAPAQPLSLWHHRLTPSSLKGSDACTQLIACTILEMHGICWSLIQDSSIADTSVTWVVLLSIHEIKQ